MNISRLVLIAVLCAVLVGCYADPPPPPRSPPHKVSVVCKTNMYGERTCVRSVYNY